MEKRKFPRIAVGAGYGCPSPALPGDRWAGWSLRGELFFEISKKIKVRNEENDMSHIPTKKEMLAQVFSCICNVQSSNSDYISECARHRYVSSQYTALKPLAEGKLSFASSSFAADHILSVWDFQLLGGCKPGRGFSGCLYKFRHVDIPAAVWAIVLIGAAAHCSAAPSETAIFWRLNFHTRQSL